MNIRFEKVNKYIREQYHQKLSKKKFLWRIYNQIDGRATFTESIILKIISYIKKNYTDCDVIYFEEDIERWRYSPILLSFKNREDQNFFLLKFSGGIDLE